jgi:MFS family permease
MIASVLTMLLFRPLRPAARPFVKDVVRDGLRILKEKVRHPGPFRVALALVFLLNAASAPGNLFTIYLRNRGVETAWFEAFTPAFAIGGMVGALGLGWLADRKGFRAAYMAAFTVGLLSLAAIFLPGHFAGPVSAFAAFGFLTSAFPVVNLALILRIAGHAESTLQQGLFSTLLSPWSLLAPLAAGWLAEWAGYPYAFGFGILCALAAFPLLMGPVQLDGKGPSKKRKA